MTVSFFVVSWAERGKVAPPIAPPINSAIRVVANMNISKGIFIVNKNYYLLEMTDHYA